MNVIEHYRKKHNLTQEEFAKLVGVSRSYVALIENGIRKPHPETAIAIERATNGEVKKEWLIFPDDYREEIQAYIEGRELEGVRE